jgi:hypothetical protein
LVIAFYCNFFLGVLVENLRGLALFPFKKLVFDYKKLNLELTLLPQSLNYYTPLYEFQFSRHFSQSVSLRQRLGLTDKRPAHVGPIGVSRFRSFPVLCRNRHNVQAPETREYCFNDYFKYFNIYSTLL